MKVGRMIWTGRTVYAKGLRWEGTWSVQGIKNMASMFAVLCEGRGMGDHGRNGGSHFLLGLTSLLPCLLSPSYPTPCTINTVNTGSMFSMTSHTLFIRLLLSL